MAELAIGIAGLVGTIDLCFRYGTALVQACKDFHASDVGLDEMAVRTEVCWSRISVQLEVMRQLESEMSLEQRETQRRVLQILQYKLEAATAVLSKPDRFTKVTVVKKLHYLTLRDSLENAVTDLEAWQKRYEPSWYQFIKVAPPFVDGVLKNVARNKPRAVIEPTHAALKFRRAFYDDGSPSFISEQTLDGLDKSSIQYCAAQFATDRSASKRYIIDTASLGIVRLKDARELAHRLREADPQIFGVMRCKGIVRRLDSSSLEFVFRVPDGYEDVKSLRQLLLSGNVPESLSMRLATAQRLVAAVYYVHLYDFVHKNISPETILNLEPQPRTGFSALTSLIGFQVIRYADAKTNVVRKERKDSLYQHPTRWNNTAVDFIMQHDIYSLGVCLLEIGLWESLISYTSEGYIRVSKMLQLPDGDDTLDRSSPETVKEHMLILSRGALRARMGDTYSKIVETCLTCLDDENMAFGDLQDFQDSDGVEVGSRYVRKIMETMNEIMY